MIQSFNKIDKVKGTLKLPGDKSIAQRALMISSLADGKSKIKNLPGSDDIISTINCLKSLGIKIEFLGEDVIVYGKGFKGFSEPMKSLHAGDSGTTARLLAGILGVQDFESAILGDESLAVRPMKRIIEPLTLMGCKIKSRNGRLPLIINPSERLVPINYELPVASAQVKSAILLAGMHLEGETSVIEDTQTRNHTENLLGLKVVNESGNIISYSSRKNYPLPEEYFIPGDISSAMFFIVLTLLTKNSELIIKDVSLNPTRTESLNLLKRMGADIRLDERSKANNEAFGDLIVKSSDLSNVKIEPEMIPMIIDEIPILAVAGIFIEGDFKIRGAKELRVKESDRIKSLCSNLSLLGLNIAEGESGFSISGEITKTKPLFNSFGDHRIAMAFSILSCLLDEGGSVDEIETVSKSNPDFLNQLKQVTT